MADVINPIIADDAIPALVRCFGESSGFAEGLDACLDALWAHTAFDAMALFRLSADARDLSLVSSRGFSERARRAGASLPVDSSLTGLAVTSQSIASSHRVAEDERIHPTVRAEMQRLSNQMIISVPLLLYRRPVGALNLVWNDIHDLTSEEEGCLFRLGYAMAVAMEHSQREHESRHDDLTGLLNRREFERAVAEQVARHERYGSRVSLLMMDLDEFKVHNDTFGHALGDHILTELGALLGTRLRETDIVCRVGGEEFACLLPETDLEAARLVAEDLRLCFRGVRFSSPDGQRFNCTVSIGVCEYQGEGTEAFVRRADAYLYAAKEAGRDRCWDADDGAPLSSAGGGD